MFPPHPSMGPDPEDPGMELPDGVSAEQVEEVIQSVMEGLGKIGLYGAPMVMMQADGEDVGFMAQFDVGEVAFTKRVQNPEQDRVDDTFRRFQSDEVIDRAEEIRRKFRKRDKDGE